MLSGGNGAGVASADRCIRRCALGHLFAAVRTENKGATKLTRWQDFGNGLMCSGNAVAPLPSVDAHHPPAKTTMPSGTSPFALGPDLWRRNNRVRPDSAGVIYTERYSFFIHIPIEFPRSAVWVWEVGRMAGLPPEEDS
jgi:hypothetical protein